jgi:hypothetical protein
VEQGAKVGLSPTVQEALDMVLNIYKGSMWAICNFAEDWILIICLAVNESLLREYTNPPPY